MGLAGDVAKKMAAPKSQRKRVAHQKPNLSITPIVISDQNSFAVVGLLPDQFRDKVREHGIAHRVDGRRLFVLARDFEAFVAAGTSAVDPALTDDDDDVPNDVDGVLAALGKRRIGGAK